MNSDIRREIRIRNRLHNKYKSSRNSTDNHKFKSQRNKVNNMIKHARFLKILMALLIPYTLVTQGHIGN